MSRLWALVPLKCLDESKQRLATVLEPALRMELVLSMAADVLAALDRVEAVERVLLISEDPEAAQLALDTGVDSFEVSPGGGLNADLECAAAFAGGQGAGSVLIVHADLPFLGPSQLRQFIAGRPGQGTRLAACKAGTGTNLLLTPLPLSFPLVYGRNSLTRFERLLGGTPEVVHNSALSRDIDEPEDLDLLLMSGPDGPPPGPATRAWVTGYRQV